MPFLHNNRPDSLQYQISIPRFSPSTLFPQHGAHALAVTAECGCTPLPILTSVVPRWEVPKGTFSYSQDFAFIYQLLATFFLLPHPLYTCPLFPAPFSKVLLLFHLAAPFLNRLPTTMTRGEAGIAFATIPTCADAAHRSRYSLWAQVRCQECSAAAWWHRALCNAGSETSPTGVDTAAKPIHWQWGARLAAGKK